MANDEKTTPATPPTKGGLCMAAATAALAVSALTLAQAGDWLRRATGELRHETVLMAQDAAMARSEAAMAAGLFAIDPEERRRLRLTATAYCPDCLDDDGPQLSASGAPVRAGRTVAVSRDLRRLLGRKVYIEGVGVRVVEDLMHPRHAGRLDLCLPNKRQAVDFGVQTLEVVILD